jgi:hypothetical protein
VGGGGAEGFWLSSAMVCTDKITLFFCEHDDEPLGSIRTGSALAGW